MENKKKKKVNAGSVIILIVILLIVLGVFNPQLLFFLNENQQSAVALFRDTYLTPYSPIHSDGGFDFLKIVAIVLLIAACWLVNKLVQFILSKVKFKNRNAKTVSSLVANLVKYAIVIYAILYALSILGVNMGAIIASLGILSLVIGFGAQSMIEDVITGMFIIFEGQLHLGDIVSIGGFRGEVTNIGIRTTQLTDCSGNIQVINNSDIRSVINLSDVATTSTVTAVITNDVDVEYVEKVMNECMVETYKKYPSLFKTQPKYLGINQFVDNGLELIFLASATEDDIYSAQRLLRKEIRMAIDNANIGDPIEIINIRQDDNIK